jgi:hypothetical protein
MYVTFFSTFTSCFSDALGDFTSLCVVSLFEQNIRAAELEISSVNCIDIICIYLFKFLSTSFLNPVLLEVGVSCDCLPPITF